MPTGAQNDQATPRPDGARLLDTRLLQRAGVAGAVLLFAAMVVLSAVAVPLFAPADERAHVDYGMELTRGHIPVAGGIFEPDFPHLGQRAGYQHVSNHPPLYYLLTGPFERLGAETGHPRAGIVLARLVGAALGLVTILLVARLAALLAASLTPRSRALVVVLATGFAATVPALVAASSSMQNDPLAVLVAVACLLVLARATRDGLTTRAVATLAVLCGLGMLTRVTFVAVVAIICASLVVLSVWPRLRPERLQWRRLALGIGRAGAVLGTTVVMAGWFYAVSVHRYGDLTGGSAVYQMEVVQRRAFPPGAENGPLGFLLHPSTWQVQLQQLVAPPSYLRGGPGATQVASWIEATVWVLLAVIAAAAAATVARRVLDRRREPEARTHRADLPARWTLAAATLLAAAAAAQLAVHVAVHGGPSSRYLLNALPLWAAGLALLVVSLGRLAPYAGTAVVTVCAGGSVLYVVALARIRARDLAWFDTLTSGARSVGMPAPSVTVTALLVLAAIGLVTVAASAIGLSLGGSGERSGERSAVGAREPDEPAAAS